MSKSKKAGGLGFILDDIPKELNGDSPRVRKGLAEPLKNKKMVSIDQEIASLEALYNQTSKEVSQDLGLLRKRVNIHREPDSVEVLETQIAREREYLQNQIIEMELKQIAESITRVTHAKKIQQEKSSFAQMVLDKFGPPIVRTTRGMANDNQKVTFNDKKAT